MNIPLSVHNVRERNVSADLHLYCGRNPDAYPRFINAKLGNPFPMRGEKDRDKVCDAYDRYLHSAAGIDHRVVIERIMLRLGQGKSIALYCHCKPERCHCDTIRDYVITNLNFG